MVACSRSVATSASIVDWTAGPLLYLLAKKGIVVVGIQNLYRHHTYGQYNKVLCKEPWSLEAP
jgi:hypothetical protein